MRISDWSSDVCSSDLLVAQNALESGGQFADEFLEEPGDVGLKPAGLLVSASSEEQQHVSVRGHPGGRQNPQRFSHVDAALPDQRTAQRILLQVGLARELAAVAAAQLDVGVQLVYGFRPGLGCNQSVQVNKKGRGA